MFKSILNQLLSNLGFRFVKEFSKSSLSGLFQMAGSQQQGEESLSRSVYRLPRAMMSKYVKDLLDFKQWKQGSEDCESVIYCKPSLDL